MDAAQRKEEWTNIEDEMWELDLRWKWLLGKVRDGRTGKFAQLWQIRESFHITEVDQVETRNTILETFFKDESHSYPNPTGDASKVLLDFLECLIDAIGQTVGQLSVIKKLMWVYWEEDAISESFYDFLQCAQQLLEYLSFTWGVTMSLFRSSELDMLCLSEKIAEQIFSCYQLAVKSMTACWQSYLVVCSRQKFLDISRAQVKVRSSCYTVGAGFSKALSAANLLTLSICSVLLRVSGRKLELVHSEFDKECGSSELKEATVVPKKDSNDVDDQWKEIENKIEKLSNEEQHQFCQKVPLKREESLAREKLLSNPIKSIAKKYEDYRNCGLKRIAHYEYFNNKGSCGKSSEEKKSKLTLVEKFLGYKFGGKSSSQKVPILDLNQPVSKDKTRSHSHAYHVLTQLQEKSSHQEQCNSGGNGCSHQCSLKKLCSAVRSDLAHRPTVSSEICPNEETEGTSNQGECSCCRCNPKMDDDSRESFVKCSPSSSISESLANFVSDDWKILLCDLQDLRIDLEQVLATVTVSRIEESVIEKFKSFMNNDDTAAVEACPHIFLLYKDVVLSQLLSLEVLETELNEQMQIWENRESEGLLRANIKGLDPDEAYSRAKNVLDLQLQAFFSLMLLMEASNKRRITHYAALLCDSFSEALNLVSSLVEARVVSGNYAIDMLERKFKTVVPADTVMSNDLFVHPYSLSHQYSKSVSLAHAFCNCLFELLSQFAS